MTTKLKCYAAALALLNTEMLAAWFAVMHPHSASLVALVSILGTVCLLVWCEKTEQKLRSDARLGEAQAVYELAKHYAYRAYYEARQALATQLWRDIEDAREIAFGINPMSMEALNRFNEGDSKLFEALNQRLEKPKADFARAFKRLRGKVMPGACLTVLCIANVIVCIAGTIYIASIL